MWELIQFSVALALMMAIGFSPLGQRKLDTLHPGEWVIYVLIFANLMVSIGLTSKHWNLK